MQLCRRIAAGRGEPDEILLDGAHLLEEAVAAGLHISGILATARALDAVAGLAGDHVPVHAAAPDVIAAASPVRSPSGVVAVATWSPRPPEALLTVPGGPLIGLAGVQDPGNVGNIIRSTDALGGSGVIALDGTAHPGGWKALRGAMGSTFRLPVALGSTDAVIAGAKARGVCVAATVASGGTPLHAAGLASPVLVLIGSEGTGLPAPLVEASDLRVTVPMRSRVNSLNAATTAALVVWELTRRVRESR